MAKVLSISSQVVHGHVGNSAGAFVLQRMGHHVLALPTVMLSNRPGYPAIGGERLTPRTLDAMLSAIDGNGWLDGIDAIATGYLPSEAHVRLCRQWIERVKSKNANAIYLCDPILGDEASGLYVEEAAGLAVRAQLLPLCDMLTPNVFELGWLVQKPVRTLEDALSAALRLARPALVVTSAPGRGPGELANVLIEQAGAVATFSPRRRVNAHGTGDFFAAVLLARLLRTGSREAAVAAAAAAIDLVLQATGPRQELELIATQELWAAAEPPGAPLHRIAFPQVGA